MVLILLILINCSAFSAASSVRTGDGGAVVNAAATNNVRINNGNIFDKNIYTDGDFDDLSVYHNQQQQQQLWQQQQQVT